MTATSRLFPHLIAGFLALLYAQYISATMYVTTAVQFVSPVAAILLAHLAWLAATRGLQDGYSNVVFYRTAVTAAGLAAIIVLLAIIAPMPAEAAPGFAEVFYSILGFIGCLMMVAIVVGVPALIIYLAGLAIARIYQRLRKGPPGGNSRLYDAGAVAVALLAIGTASLEGVPGAYSLAPAGQASSTYAISAPAARVWQAVGTATSPNFPLPAMLHSIPRPVAIVVDEGAALEAGIRAMWQCRRPARPAPPVPKWHRWTMLGRRGPEKRPPARPPGSRYQSQARRPPRRRHRRGASPRPADLCEASGRAWRWQNRQDR